MMEFMASFLFPVEACFLTLTAPGRCGFRKAAAKGGRAGPSAQEEASTETSRMHRKEWEEWRTRQDSNL